MLLSLYYTPKVVLELSEISTTEMKNSVSHLFRFGIQNQVAHITQLLSFRLSYYILSDYQGVPAVGVFSNGISIAESIWIIAKSMAMVQYSWISNTSDRISSAKKTLQFVKLGLVFSLIILLPLLLIPVSAYVFIFGQGFAGIKPVIWTLVPGVLFYNVSILVGHYYSGTGRY
jgi:O-antigen/teichoic acid export membrane protein